jgi:flagellar biosynthetic protein FlhB
MVAVSRDLTAAMALLGGFAVLRLAGPWMARELVRESARIVGSASTHSLNHTTLAAYAGAGFWLIVKIAGPVLGGAAIGALATSWLQTGFLISFYPLLPTAEKINPLTGLKRLFSWQGLFDTGKSVVKMGLMLIIAWWTLAPRAMLLADLGTMPLSAGVARLLNMAELLTLRTGLAMLILGAADYAFQWWQTERRMMMSPREMREEWKETEGDPVARMRRRQRRRQLLEQRITPEMREATVVVTNPVHLAVALKYRLHLMPAPKIVAKGRGYTARRILQIARTYNVPVVEDVGLARALYKAVRVGDYIPRALYRAVAEILALIYRREAQRRAAVRRMQKGS